MNSIDAQILEISVISEKYRKPKRPCLFCGVEQSRLKRHILTKRKDNTIVAPLLDMSPKEQDSFIAQFKRKAIKNHNIEYLKGKKEQVLRERKTKDGNDEIPVLCTGCDGFFKNSYKSTHQKICPGNTNQNLMLPLVSIEAAQTFENFFERI